MGEVIEVGSGVEKVRVGNRVVLPFNISCGFCKNCERGLTNYCLTTQPEPSFAGAAYGFADMGPGNYCFSKALSNDDSGRGHSSDRTNSTASDAPVSRSMPASSHSTETGPE